MECEARGTEAGAGVIHRIEDSIDGNEATDRHGLRRRTEAPPAHRAELGKDPELNHRPGAMKLG